MSVAVCSPGRGQLGPCNQGAVRQREQVEKNGCGGGNVFARLEGERGTRKHPSRLTPGKSRPALVRPCDPWLFLGSLVFSFGPNEGNDCLAEGRAGIR